MLPWVNIFNKFPQQLRVISIIYTVLCKIMIRYINLPGNNNSPVEIVLVVNIGSMLQQQATYWGLSSFSCVRQRTTSILNEVAEKINQNFWGIFLFLIDANIILVFILKCYSSKVKIMSRSYNWTNRRFARQPIQFVFYRLCFPKAFCFLPTCSLILADHTLQVDANFYNNNKY